ncbi:MoaD/ThiS family protein [Demequina sp. TTPB684]|uniref:MoaD/ThiS family protein n=1 Tax=unclassified Demequina TaxID=2620311 RepID=UPI001CF3DBDD|nr:MULTISPECIES: MoaD/ThiS family protein [unclassified Demequina]MCB2412117.1 MoaD/ThiS family protein [Demequina sp. TTPB684]UPU88904.1 MoaD/ThiS family protein [Demequina sp. TMPB413]
MSVTARLFAAAAEAVGAHETAVDVSDVAGLRAVLGAASESAASVIPQCAVLEGGVRRDDDHVLADGAKVDVMPPFAGG